MDRIASYIGSIVNGEKTHQSSSSVHASIACPDTVKPGRLAKLPEAVLLHRCSRLGFGDGFEGVARVE